MPGWRASPLGVVVVVLSACSAVPAGEVPGTDPVRPVSVTAPEAGTVVLAGADATALALETSAALFRSAPAVVLAPAGDAGAQAPAASAAVALGVPLLPVPTAGEDVAAVLSELERLGATTALGVGLGTPRPASRPSTPAVASTPAVPSTPAAPATAPTGPDDPAAAAALADVVEIVAVPAGAGLGEAGVPRLGAETRVPVGDLVEAVASLDLSAPDLLTVAGGDRDGSVDPPVARLPAVARAQPLESVLVVTRRGGDAIAAAATARAAGARVVPVAGTDPRADPDAVAAIAAGPVDTVVALGDGFGDPDRLRARMDVAATGVQLPGGGQTLFPGRRLVALYGHPGAASLGVLGEQDARQSVTRARTVADEYAPHSDVPVVPAFEVIATVASADAGADGDYSNASSLDRLRPYVDAAEQAGVYVVLDLQPGRTDFLTQARLYEALLARPHVGLALDPEWRLAPGQRHLRQIGSVGAAEVNEVVDWLADLVADRDLPQKLLVLHQFRTSMIRNRDQVDLSRDELAVLVQMDGNGAPETKLQTWRALRAGAPEALWFGWKNFYDEDTPTFTPRQTLALEPTPWFISYQ